MVNVSSILVVGSLAYDGISTPSGSVDRALGGSANYFSLAASLYSKVRVVGVVGADYDKKDEALLTDRGVDLSGVEHTSGKTFFWQGKYEGDLNDAITLKTELNVFESFDPKIPANFRDSKFVFLANIDPELQLKVLSQVEAPEFVGMDTMNFWITSKLDALKKILSKVDVVLINEKEAEMLTGAPNAISAAPLIAALGPKAVAIKRGEYGFALFTRDQGFNILPAMPMPLVVDPTGAGDTFAGGFFGHLSSLGRPVRMDDLREACVTGTLLASFTIQDFSVRALAQVKPEDVARRRAEYMRVIGR